MAKSQSTLGFQLKQARELMTLTLRQVEEVTGVSNAYLSQLENNKIKNPSANILYKLASIYNIKLDNLLLHAGMIENNSIDHTTIKHLNSKKFSIEKITPEEEEVLLEYLKFIRQSKKTKK